ncbi:MAG: hypothetical protein Q7R48_02190 [bacterium]|nr:hypothetical protein [bacterium]
MWELPESDSIRVELIAAWGIITLLVGNMMLERLRGFSRELFGSRGTPASQPNAAERQNKRHVRWVLFPAAMAAYPVAEFITSMF